MFIAVLAVYGSSVNTPLVGLIATVPESVMLLASRVRFVIELLDIAGLDGTVIPEAFPLVTDKL